MKICTVPWNKQLIHTLYKNVQQNFISILLKN